MSSQEINGGNLSDDEKVSSDDETLGNSRIFWNEKHKLWMRYEIHSACATIFPKTREAYLSHTDSKMERQNGTLADDGRYFEKDLDGKD